MILLRHSCGFLKRVLRICRILWELTRNTNIPNTKARHQILFAVERDVVFTDAIIGVSARMAGVEYLASFDKKHMDKLANLGLKRVETLEEVL